MTRDLLTIARLFRHEWPTLAMFLLTVALLFGLVGYVSMKGAAL